MKNPYETCLTEIEKMCLYTVYLNEGIVPIVDPSYNIKKFLNDLPPDEATKAKRKFRKLWRKLYKEKLNKSKEDRKYSVTQQYVALCGTDPGRTVKYNRKKMVMNALKEKISKMCHDINKTVNLV